MVSQFITYLDEFNGTVTNTTTSYAPVSGNGGYIHWDGSKYNGVIAVYVELTAKYDTTGCIPNGPPTLRWRLYDETNSTQIGDTFSVSTLTNDLSNYKARRGSTSVHEDMPTGEADLLIQFKKSCGTSVTATGARLIIVQRATDKPKTRVFIPIGSAGGTLSTSYVPMATIFAPKYYKYLADNFGTIDQITIGATIKIENAASSVYFKMDNAGETDALGEINTNATAYTWVESSDISGSITDTETYMGYLKTTSGLRLAGIQNAFLIIDLNPVTKYQGVFSPHSRGENVTSAVLKEHAWYEQIYDVDDWQDVTRVATHQSTLKQAGGVTMKTTLFDDGSQDTNTDINTTNTSFTRVESSSFTEPAEASEIGCGGWLSSSGRGKSGNFGHNWILQTITNINPRRIYITQ